MPPKAEMVPTLYQDRNVQLGTLHARQHQCVQRQLLYVLYFLNPRVSLGVCKIILNKNHITQYSTQQITELYTAVWKYS